MRVYHHQYDANVVEAARLEKLTNDTMGRAYHTWRPSFAAWRLNHAIKVEIS